MRRAWKIGGIACLSLALAIIVLRVAPKAALREHIPSSQAVVDREGRLLRLSLAADQQYRLWTPIDEIPPSLIEALLLHEDQHFYQHPGVNPISLLRAATTTLTGGARQGGSTLSMQLARLFYGIETRSIPGKLQQIAAALWLEARYPKQELLEAHLNLLPYGGNVQGVGTASRIYFGKTVGRLSLPETLSLVLIPQAPLQRGPRGVEPESLRSARARLFARWLATHPEDRDEAALIAQPLHYRALAQLPFEAPQLSARLLASSPQRSVIHATLDLRLQHALEQAVAETVSRESRIGIRNASALLLDWRSMNVLAAVGSASFFSKDISGQVDGTRAKRSPGSALKPFIYALAIDQGLIHPLSVLKDAPTAFGPYSPENFDGGFVGPISAQEALIRSRNVPAVALTARLSKPGLYDFLKLGGVARMAPEAHYGLALTLGGGEVTMEEMARLYALLPNRGRLRALRYLADDADDKGTPLLSEEASYMVLDMLRQNPRPDDLVLQGIGGGRPIAWKTGTSWGFRDAWTAGVFGPNVLVVWVGEFDGRSNPAFVGVQAAAPLFFRMADRIRGLQTEPDPAPRQPPNLAKVEICAASGDLPNLECPQRVTTWFIPGKSPIRVSQIHRKIAVDTRTGRQACAPFDARYVREEVYEFWPSDLMRLFAQAGMPRRRPPPTGDCASQDISGNPPQIVSPLSGVTYPVRANRLGRESFAFNANAEGDVATLYWFVDDAYIGDARPGTALAWTPQRPGRFLIRAIDERGRSGSREMRIELLR
jgi:penicillin-binding protein 1C